ncbi:olfactory receptor 1361-like [Monodelphis domestica]|uniref:olfactory receptor 1361-like n=1 Tax=Monodelphis domestica TaxID=13616 RepID=UPI0024E2011F|nr:olfactory receptor 1361-like [Monodelphis domestica]
METYNYTSVTEFVLLGLTSQLDIQPVIFGVIFAMYLITIVGNSMIITVTWIDPKLKTPMYFLLSQLSIIDICFTTITVPQLLIHTFSRSKTISFTQCMTQVFFFVAVGNMEGYLLATMAYDRYVAICNPLRYGAIVTQKFCVSIVLVSWLLMFLNSLLHTILVSRLNFCSNHILHFFCDLPPLMQLSCSRPFINEIIILTEGVAATLSPFVFILASYVCIAVTVLGLRSTAGLRKAVSTCGSHIVVVTLFYGTIIRLYFQPVSSYTLDRDRQVAVFYTVVTPMLNPIIYSLRNQEVKGALQRTLRKLQPKSLSSQSLRELDFKQQASPSASVVSVQQCSVCWSSSEKKGDQILHSNFSKCPNHSFNQAKTSEVIPSLECSILILRSSDPST